MSPDVAIEGLLFYKSTPQKRAFIMNQLGLTPEQFESALMTLRNRLSVGAVRLVETNESLTLMTAPELAPLIETIRRDELKADIGKAGIETLAVILYREPVSRAEIDRIRGVNSSFSLRTLLMRGLIERKLGAGGTHLFSATPALYAHLGITHKHELPNHSAYLTALEAFESTVPEAADTTPLS
jgi:segregation and condensation protein B